MIVRYDGDEQPPVHGHPFHRYQGQTVGCTVNEYLLLKHYRGAPEALNNVPMDQWTPEEVAAHMQFMQDYADRLQARGEYIDGQAVAPEGTFVRYDGEGRPPVTTALSRKPRT